MGVYRRKDSKHWWYRFNWNGETIRESTKQTNKRVAEQMEAAHRTRLALGEVGIRKRNPAPTLAAFAEQDLMPFIEASFAAKQNTVRYYSNGVRALLEYGPLKDAPLDTITTDVIAGYVAKRQSDGLQVTSINRELQVLRRAFHLATEWRKVDQLLSRVRMIPGERHRERVLSDDEERRYLEAAAAIGNGIIAAYNRALEGIRATLRGQVPIPPADPFRLRDIATILLDCGLRPEECFRLRWEHVTPTALTIPYGKTSNARRQIQLTSRAAGILDMRRSTAAGEWVFPAGNRSGHVDASTVKKPHHRACTLAKVEPFILYTFRHTCLTRWAPHMDPYTLAYLAGHSDFATTRRYVHPRQETVRRAMEKARDAQTPHDSRHGEENEVSETTGKGDAIN